MRKLYILKYSLINLNLKLLKNILKDSVPEDSVCVPLVENFCKETEPNQFKKPMYPTHSIDTSTINTDISDEILEKVYMRDTQIFQIKAD